MNDRACVAALGNRREDWLMGVDGKKRDRGWTARELERGMELSDVDRGMRRCNRRQPELQAHATEIWAKERLGGLSAAVVAVLEMRCGERWKPSPIEPVRCCGTRGEVPMPTHTRCMTCRPGASGEGAWS